jgi:hypothetical protein
MQNEDSEYAVEQFDEARRKFLKFGKVELGDAEVRPTLHRELKDKQRRSKDREKPYRTLDRTRTK